MDLKKFEMFIIKMNLVTNILLKIKSIYEFLYVGNYWREQKEKDRNQMSLKKEKTYKFIQ